MEFDRFPNKIKLPMKNLLPLRGFALDVLSSLTLINIEDESTEDLNSAKYVFQIPEIDF